MTITLNIDTTLTENLNAAMNTTPDDRSLESWGKVILNTNDTPESPAMTPNATMFYRGMDKELQRLELEIRKGMRSCFIVGNNLGIIQEKGLYKSRGFETFEKYCKDTLDISRQQGYRLINAARVYYMLKDSYKGGRLPQKESQCRPLTDPDLSDLDVTLIWAIVVEAGTITAASITKALKEYRGENTNSKAPQNDLTPDSTPDTTPDAENLPFTPDSEDKASDSTDLEKQGENKANSSSDDLPKIGEPEPKTDEPKEEPKADDSNVSPIGDIPEDKKESDKGSEVPNVSKGELVAENLLLKAQIQELELKLLKAQSESKGTGSVPRSKMAIMLYKAGFNVLLKSIADDQKTELTELYNSLTGR